MKIDRILEVVANVSLFRDMKADCVKLNIENATYKVKQYKKGEILAVEGDDCTSMGMVLSGTLELRKEFPAGHYMTLTYLETSDVFGEVIVFSHMHKFPATILAISDTEILYFDKAAILKLMEGCESVTRNFVSILSNKILMLNKKTSILAFKTIEEKVASYILEEYKTKESLTFNIPLNRKELAGYLNVPRPSLSRTMANMKDRGLIDYYQNTIKIVDLNLLEECLFH